VQTLHYGARWAERPAKNRIDELPPEGANAAKACYDREGVQTWSGILIVPLGRTEKEVADEAFCEDMAKGGFLELVG